jgi:hypothetical protein
MTTQVSKEPAMSESVRQRELIKAAKLLTEAFDVMREPLRADEKAFIWKDEPRIVLVTIDARDALMRFISYRQRKGIRAAKPDAE